jgi:hypothetical protein
MLRPFFFLTLFLFVGCSGAKPKIAGNGCDESRAVVELGTNRIKTKVYRFDKCKRIDVETIESLSEPIEFSQAFKVEGYGDEVLISPQILEKGKLYLSSLQAKLKKAKIQRIQVIATGVFRRASNGKKYLESIGELFETKARIISSLEEAKLALSAVSYRHQDSALCVWDIGGDSMLLACRADGASVFAIDLPGSQLITNDLTRQNGYRSFPDRVKYYRRNFEAANVQVIKTFLGKHPSAVVYGIGGVHERSIIETLRVIDPKHPNSYSFQDAENLFKLFKGSKSTSFTGKYGKNQFLNVDLVLFTMRELGVTKIQVSDQKPLDAFVRE